jgi:protein-tyrosine phosphatase
MKSEYPPKTSDPTGSDAVGIRLEAAPNFRDVGGYRTETGGAVRRGLVFRSGHLADLTEVDMQELADLRICTVVDLRHPFEIQMFGHDRLPPDIKHVNIPIASAQMDESIRDAMKKGAFRRLPDLAEASREMVRHRTDELASLLRLVAEPTNLPLVFHCIGGKDRTGVASSILLGVLGVPWSTIREDYLRSNELLGPTLTARLSHLTRVIGAEDGAPTEEDLDAARRFFVLEPHYIDAALEEMHEMAGSLEGYVREILGLDSETIDDLRSLLLEPADSTRTV